MKNEDFTFVSEEGTEIFVYKWLPEANKEIIGVVQIAHGMAENAGRYEALAKKLTDDGFAVYANDHRGHGKTSDSVEKQGILANNEGFKWMVKDVHKLTEIIKRNHADIPVFLLGHSMGSFIAQKYIMIYGNELDGVILSGTNGRQGFMLTVGSFVAMVECQLKGRDAKSLILTQMSFGSYNDNFKPLRTKFDWLSRDNSEVDKYITDPYCGAVFTAGFYYDFLEGLKEIEKQENMDKVPKDLPIYMFSGAKDPVGKEGKGVRDLYDSYKSMGVKDVLIKLYKGGRHEMLNEINREEVMENLVKWIKSHV